MAREEHPIRISQNISPIVLKASYGFTQAKGNWEIIFIQHLGGWKRQPLAKNQWLITPKTHYKTPWSAKNHKPHFTSKTLILEQKPIQPWKSNVILSLRDKISGSKKSFLSPSPPLSNLSFCCMWKTISNLVYYAYFASLYCFAHWFCYWDAPLASIRWILEFWAWISPFNHTLRNLRGVLGLF